MTGGRQVRTRQLAGVVLGCLVLITGVAIAFEATMWTGFGAGLPVVPYGAEMGATVTASWEWGWMLRCLAAILLLTGASEWRLGRINLAQSFGALCIGVPTILFSYLSVGARELGREIQPCVRMDCWPAQVQEGLIAAPLVAASVAMLVVAVFAHRLGWLARAAIPGATYVLLRLAQVILWEPVVVPYLAGS